MQQLLVLFQGSDFTRNLIVYLPNTFRCEAGSVTFGTYPSQQITFYGPQEEHLSYLVKVTPDGVLEIRRASKEPLFKVKGSEGTEVPADEATSITAALSLILDVANKPILYVY